MYSTVVLDECFAVDESPSRSANVISWGPHNILSMCTKWMVKLYLATLRQDAAQIIIRHHPLCHRHDKQSLEVIHSARWAPSLLHEVHYPATARLCVATSANVVVYRVSRHGNHSVSVSHGVGIAVTHPSLATVPKLQEQEQQMETYQNDVLEESAIPHLNKNSGDDNTKHYRRKRKEETYNSSTGKQERIKLQISNAKVSKTATQQTNQRKNIQENHRQQKRRATQQQRRRRQVKVDSESGSEYSSSESSSESSESSSESSPTDDETSVNTKNTMSNQEIIERYHRSNNKNNKNSKNNDINENNELRFTLIDYYWLDYEQLLIVTNVGVHVVSLWNNFSDEESEQILTLPQEPHYTLVHDTLGVHALFIACTCLHKIDNIHREFNSCNGSKSTYLLLLASPFVIRVLLVTSHDPLELCKPSNSWTFNNSISNSDNNQVRSVTVNIVGLHYVEIEAMNSVPASLCCYIDNDDDDGHRDDHRNNIDWTHHREEEEQCVQLISELPSTKEQVQEYIMKVGAIISSPNETIRGTFEVRINSNTLASTMVENSTLLEHSKKRLQSIEECNRQHTLITSEWRLNARFDLSLLANETALRSLHLVDLSSVQLPLTQELAMHNMSGNALSLPLSSRYFMIGLTRHYVFGFTSRGMQPILLFQCPSLASAFEMPLHAALAVSGIAIHASCTLALLLLQNGQVNSVSMFVKPNCVNDTNGLLSRMLHLCGMNESHEQNTNTINEAQRVYRKGEVNTIRTPITANNNNSNNNNNSSSSSSTSLPQSLSYSLSQHNSLQLALWERQHNYSFFVWEQLFPSDAECVSLRLYSEEHKRLMHFNRNANNRNTNSDDKSLCNLSRNVLSCHYSTTEALYKRYLELRDEYNVDLYLRHVMPSNEEVFTRCLYKRHNCLSIASTSQYNRTTSSHDFVANNIEHWQWWELLLAIWRRAPCNVWCLYEIILANALLVVAKYTHYANFDLSSDEIFEQANDKCSTNTQTLSYCGAVTFVQMYIAHEMEQEFIQERNTNTINNNNNKTIQENKRVPAQTELLLPMDLQKSRKWVKHLSEWLQHYCADILCTHGTCLQHEIITNNTHDNQYSCSNDNNNIMKHWLIGKYLFPCSLCDAKGVAKLTSAFSYDVVHSSHEQHTTIFSPKTFCALSMLSDEAVLTKCRDCGFRDYARHALCVICGGVLVEGILKCVFN